MLPGKTTPVPAVLTAEPQCQTKTRCGTRTPSAVRRHVVGGLVLSSSHSMDRETGRELGGLRS